MRGITIKQIITDKQDESINYYFRDVSKLDRIDPSEEDDLIRKAQSGDKRALDKIITSNLRFVISIAKQYQGKGLPLVDLIQEGNLGIIEAVPKFNPDRGYKFISYAVWWIRQSITKALSNYSRTIRVPGNQINNYNQYSKLQNDVADDKSYEINDKIDMYNISLIENSIKVPLSLNSTVGDSDSNILLDVIPNKNIDKLDDPLNNEDLIKVINTILSKLPNREHDILRMSFGIGVQQMPFEKIAKYFGIGYERVRQLQQKALQTLQTKYGEKLGLII